MARTIRFEVRVEPAIADAIDAAAGIASRSRWIEVACLEKLHRDRACLPLQRSDQPEPELPPLPVEHTFPDRPPPRIGGGRKQH